MLSLDNPVSVLYNNGRREQRCFSLHDHPRAHNALE